MDYFYSCPKEATGWKKCVGAFEKKTVIKVRFRKSSDKCMFCEIEQFHIIIIKNIVHVYYFYESEWVGTCHSEGNFWMLQYDTCPF